MDLRGLGGCVRMGASRLAHGNVMLISENEMTRKRGTQGEDQCVTTTPNVLFSGYQWPREWRVGVWV